MAVGRVRRITLKQAKSYERSVPNGMGVTAIASVNGDGAFQRRGLDYRARYAQTREMLGNPLPEIVRAAPAVRPNRELSGAALASKKRKEAREAAAAAREKKREEDTASVRWQLEEGKKSRREAYEKSSKSRKSGAKTVMAKKKTTKKKAAAKKSAAKRPAKRPATKPKARKSTAKRKSGGALRALKALGYSDKQAKAIIARKRAARTVGGFRQIKVRLGGRSVPTYAYRTKSGAAKRIPDYAIAGIPKADFSKYGKGKIGEGKGLLSTKKAEAIRKRLNALGDKRAAAMKLVEEGKSLFYPNARVVSYEDLMEENKRKGKKKAKKKAHKKGHKKAHHKGKKAHGKSHAPKMTKSQKKANSKRRTRARSDIKELRKLLGKYKPAKKSGKARVKARKSARKGLTSVASYFRNPMDVYGSYEENARSYEENRRHRKSRKSGKGRRRAHRNGFAASLMESLKTGAVAVGGFLVHRALTKVLDDQLAKVTALSSGNAAKYRGILSGLVTVAIGVPLTDMAGKGLSSEQRSMIKTGMIVSFVQGAIVTALKGAGQDKVVGYLGAFEQAAAGYPQAYRGYGEYMATSGMGEYMATSGLGEYMATSGFGAFEQAAAGYGAIEQAAAGYGAIEQAAAGMGEYMATGVQGIGEYDVQAPAVYSGYGRIDEGIMPNTSAAEYALSVAEATAGIGDVEALSTVNPSDLAVPVGDGSEELRTGVLEGGDGIFGG